VVGSSSLSGAVRSQRGRTYAVILVTAAAVVAFDHLTKWLVTRSLPLDGEIWSGAFVSIHHVENRGAAFGVFPQFQWLYLVVALIVALYILVAGHRFGTTWYRQVVLGMVLGGAISNGVDRLVQGYVVDFIDFHFWPVFNVADSAIVIGIVVAVLTFRARQAPPQRTAT
jgi:signal peptidase II